MKKIIKDLQDTRELIRKRRKNELDKAYFQKMIFIVFVQVIEIPQLLVNT